jgi:hypothetical protein
VVVVQVCRKIVTAPFEHSAAKVDQFSPLLSNASAPGVASAARPFAQRSLEDGKTTP